nr:histone-lysine N-methyltransferase setd3 isoform X1 [Ipomoea batatas]GMC94143.1 histone-lysine N-methyltransferase setd3 isoform X1 [Ipomoea batatas]
MGKLQWCIHDFLNHDGGSDSCVLNDEGKQHSEVIADRDYAPGDQVLIRYGKFSNATLLLDFGFTLLYNAYDQLLSGSSQTEYTSARPSFFNEVGTFKQTLHASNKRCQCIQFCWEFFHAQGSKICSR